MYMNYILAIMMICFWFVVLSGFIWDPNYSTFTNVTIIFLTILLLVFVHWVPFWLIFLK